MFQNMKFDYNGQCEKKGDTFYFYDKNGIDKIAYDSTYYQLTNKRGRPVVKSGKDYAFKLEDGTIDPSISILNFVYMSFFKSIALKLYEQRFEIPISLILYLKWD